ncbi:MAG TPA: beta-galactosidase, partial [Bryobacteraceae bacterium]
MDTRREFIKKTSTAAWLLSTSGLPALASIAPPAAAPWYRRVTRWGQVNITEKDPPQYDIPWWRAYWNRTNTRGIIANAGGIIAYYPTKIPLHKRSEFLGDRDLFGDLSKAAHEDGLAVFARMDSNRAHEEFYQAHPDWFAVDPAGRPYRAADLYIACINSPYYTEHLPEVLKEIATLYHPEGFTDNSWSGLGRDSICHCKNCKESFHQKTGYDLPVKADWDDKVYKAWLRWNYDRRIELWEFNNSITKQAGGPDCIWSGMNSGSISGQSRSFRDCKAIAERAEILMLDDQARTDPGGFQHNGEIGKLYHGLLGWDKLIPESMAMYQAHKPWFRLASKPYPEARMWMVEGLAGGISPWWHMIGATHEDRRMHHNPEATFNWEAENEDYLLHRQPVATIGLAWTQENTDYYGRDKAEERVELPWRGMAGALIRARIPYIPIHLDHLDRDGKDLVVLILPDLAVISDEQAQAIRRFVEKGGSLIATGNTGLLTGTGEPRADFALADLFGAHLEKPGNLFVPPAGEKMAGEAYHTYLRIAEGDRHPVLKGFEETDILPFGGLLDSLRLDPGAIVPLTFIPQFPTYPPEKAWMRIPKTDIPGLILRETLTGPIHPRSGGPGYKVNRFAYLPADIDRQYGRSNLPDHGNLLKNIIEWAALGDIPITIEGAGLIDT